MSTKENNPSLLSKVAKFVRNPTTNWTDLDKQDPEPDAGYSKQALKEMIERKRQNDFVRKREFDQLRRLRSRDPGVNAEMSGRPSYFQSSLPNNSDERAMTIKKIDEIEAQMSNQWWQGKSSGVPKPVTEAAPKKPDATDVVDDMGYAPTRLSPMRSEAALSGNESSDFPPTEDNSGFGPSSATIDARAGQKIGDGHGFIHSRSHAVELVNGMTDSEMEEAAIRFANGDDAGAESSLQSALQDPSVALDQAMRWAAALLDLYRATGQQLQFEGVAITFAQRFGRSAPTWFSMPEAVGRSSSSAHVRTRPSRLLLEPNWVCPAHCTATTADELQLALANVESPWLLDWSNLSTIETEAVAPFAALFEQWSQRSVELRFTGARHLERALRQLAPSGQPGKGQAPWKLRLDALRVMGMQDDFELVALDYCVTFEVSPPAWQDAVCSYRSATVAGALSASAESEASQAQDIAQEAGPQPEYTHAATIHMGLDAIQATIAELSGELLGEATDALDKLELARGESMRLVVSCANLIRVDFSAAGSILNWAAHVQAEGCQIQFHDVHRLVAAFFGVIGINEHARIVMRSN